MLFGPEEEERWLPPERDDACKAWQRFSRDGNGNVSLASLRIPCVLQARMSNFLNRESGSMTTSSVARPQDEKGANASMGDGLPLRIENLTKTFRQGTNTVTALDGVSASVGQSEFVAVMGASGSGKSTLLHVIAGLMPPTSGSVHVGGENIAKMSDSRKTKFRRKNIGVIFQQFNLIPTLTAEENILLPAQLERGTRVSDSRLDELLDLLEIKERRTHRPDALSGGEQQRVAIGRALLVDPAIILADEPTGNLDSANSTTICTLLRKLCTEQNRTLVVVTHDKNVAGFGDRTIHLTDGRTE